MKLYSSLFLKPCSIYSCLTVVVFCVCVYFYRTYLCSFRGKTLQKKKKRKKKPKKTFDANIYRGHLFRYYIIYTHISLSHGHTNVIWVQLPIFEVKNVEMWLLSLPSYRVFLLLLFLFFFFVFVFVSCNTRVNLFLASFSTIFIQISCE